MLYAGPLLKPLYHLVETQPSFPVLYRKNGNLTAKDLLQKSINLAVALKSKGYKENDVAVIAAQTGEEFLEIMYAIVMLKGIIAIIDPEMGRQNYEAKMRQLNPQWMFIDSRLLLLQEHPLLKAALLKFIKTLPNITLVGGCKLVAVGKWLPIIRKHLSLQQLIKKNIQQVQWTPDDGKAETLIIYTSGTLSVPKGVFHTGENLAQSISSLGKLFTKNPQAIVGTYLPHFMLLGIAAGLPVKLMEQTLRADKKITWIRQENIGVIFGPPSDYLPMIHFCETNNLKMPTCLQHIMIGSAPVHTKFLQRLIAVLPPTTQVTCTYGMTENLLVATIDGREKLHLLQDGDVVGKPVQDVVIRIAEDGEIMVRSPQLFSRYYHEDSGKEWHASGDLGYLDNAGNIVLKGRKKEMIIRRNMNIYPALYENTIKNIKGIDEAAMVGIYDETLHDEKVYLALEGNNINIALVQKQLAAGKHSIDKEALPDHIFTMTIPRKGRQHKIDRQAIIDHIKKAGV